MLSMELAQINPTVGDLAGNAARILALWRASEADLLVLPELALGGYPLEDLVLNESFIDAVERAAARLVVEGEGFRAALALTLPLRRDGSLYNAMQVVSNGKIAATILKHHLPNYGVFDERRVFAAGPLPEPVIVNGHAVGLMICEDVWYPAAAAHLKQLGAELLIVANASPFETDKRGLRLAPARARVEETGLPLLYLNQWGGQDELVFDGGSFALDAAGMTVARLPHFADGILRAVWDGRLRCGDAPTAPEDDLDLIYRALVTGLRDYTRKSGFTNILLGMSGGIDSALSAAIAVDALGPAQVRCVMLPSRYTGADSLEDAADCSRRLGVRHDTIAIESVLDGLHAALAAQLPDDTPPVTFENLQSRARGVILMALSNATGAMVLSTGNKSEMATGYATLYGDMNGGFNVLKDVYKTQVFTLARFRNAVSPANCLGPTGEVIPPRIIAKAPSAELRPDQTDQDTLPPYNVLDDILSGLIERDLGIDDIVDAGHDKATVRRVARMLANAEYKRRQACPGVKITLRSFGKDRRYPIASAYKP